MSLGDFLTQPWYRVALLCPPPHFPRRFSERGLSVTGLLYCDLQFTSPFSGLVDFHCVGPNLKRVYVDLDVPSWGGAGKFVFAGLAYLSNMSRCRSFGTPVVVKDA